MKKRSKKDILIPACLIVSGGMMMAVQVADMVTVAGFVLIFTGCLLFVNFKSGQKVEAKGNEKIK